MIKRGLIIYILFLLSNVLYAQNWHSIGENFLDGGAESLGVIDGKLYVSGIYTPTERIAVWDRAKWDSIGFGQNGPIYCFEKYLDKIYFGGGFLRVGEWNQYPHTMSIVAWDESNWFPVLTEYFGGRINAMQVYDGELYVTGEGNFFEIDGVAASKIAKWNGTSWSAVGNPSGLGLGNSRGLCMATYTNKLIVGGYFDEAGGVDSYCIASWNGSEWDTIGEYGLGGIVNDLAVDTVNNYLYAGGLFLFPVQ